MMHDGPLNKGCFQAAVVPSRRVAESFDGPLLGGMVCGTSSGFKDGPRPRHLGS